MARLSPAWRSALREFVIIVAGVLAALAAQAWWSSAQDARREREYLAQLLGDTRENERRLEEAIAVEERAAAATLSAQAALKGPGPAPADSIIEWFNRAGTTSDFQPVTGTYRAIASTGDLRLIRTDTLRTLLTSYAAALESEGARLEQLRGMVLSEISSFARALPFMHGVFSGTVDPAGVDVRTATPRYPSWSSPCRPPSSTGSPGSVAWSAPPKGCGAPWRASRAPPTT